MQKHDICDKKATINSAFHNYIIMEDCILFKYFLFVVTVRVFKNEINKRFSTWMCTNLDYLVLVESKSNYYMRRLWAKLKMPCLYLSRALGRNDQSDQKETIFLSLR